MSVPFHMYEMKQKRDGWSEENLLLLSAEKS